MNTCIIAIGSNINAESNIAEMLKLLNKKVTVLQVSKMVKTKPIGITEQNDFINGAVKVETEFDYQKLKLTLKQIEDELGRDRLQEKFGPRSIDLDILVFNDEITDPDFYTRDFLRDSAKELGFIAY